MPLARGTQADPVDRHGSPRIPPTFGSSMSQPPEQVSPNAAPTPPTAGPYVPADDPWAPRSNAASDPWAPSPAAGDVWKRDRDEWIPTGPTPDSWTPSSASSSEPLSEGTREDARPYENAPLYGDASPYEGERPFEETRIRDDARARDLDWPPTRAESSGRRRTGILVAVAALTAVAIGAAVFGLSKHGGQAAHRSAAPTSRAATHGPTAGTSKRPSQPAGPAATEAAGVNAVLKASVATRGQLTGVDLTTCDGLYSAIPTLQTVITQRQAELRSAQNAATGALPNGAQLHTSLVTAFQDSLAADQAYLTWAKSLTKCAGTPPKSPDSAKVNAANIAAGTAKASFLAMWKPIATTYGQPTYSNGGI